MRVLLILFYTAAATAWAVPDALQGTAQGHTGAAGYWYEKVKHNGLSPTIANGKSWMVFRNVKDYGALGDGTTDDSAAIQKAINAGDGTTTRDTGRFGTTGAPAVVYFPPGTYLVSSPIKNIIETVLMGDPTNRPTIKASPAFKDSTLLYGRDSKVGGLVAFYHEIKNLVLDSTLLPGTQKITLLDYGVSQGCQLSNVMFHMPIGAKGHAGMSSTGTASPLIINDLQFVGGSVGYTAEATQYHFKNLYFRDVGTAIKISSLVQGTGQGLRFENCQVGIDASSGGSGFFALIDSTATNTSTLVAASDSRTPQGSLVLENVLVDASVPATVSISGKTVLNGSVPTGTTWIKGNIYSTSPQPEFSRGKTISTSRPPALINGTGFYHTVVPPTYAEYDVSQVVNVKDVRGHPVAGDGAADDTASLQAILDAAAGKQIVYFPHGIYLLSDTLVLPPGSRLVGEAWTELSATGSKFKDATKPRPMIKVGNPGDVGVAQMTDFLFTVDDVLPGTIMVEVNMAGSKPGDVGFFNNHFRIGGARGSKVETKCRTPETCNAARLCAHFTPTSSAYWENSWAWSADHDLDGSNTAKPSTAGGFLVESKNGTWMLGIGIEHQALYQMNIYHAENVFLGLQQGEAAYWQGNGNTLLTPAPWADSLLPSEPTWSWCAVNDAQCRMGLYQRVSGSRNINLYGAGFWNFVSGPSRAFCSTDCHENAALFENNTRLFSYGISTFSVKNLVLEPSDGKYVEAVPHSANKGTTGGVMAAYLRQSG